MLTLLFIIFLIANIYTPLSFHYAMIIDFLMLFFIKFGYKSTTIVVDKATSKALLVFLFYTFFVKIIMTGSWGMELSVDCSYFLLCSISFPYILNFFIDKKVDVLSAISVVLSMHCIIVILEVFFPEIGMVIASFTDYNREDIDRYLSLNYRKMGLAASFDTAGYFSVISSTVSILLFITRGKFFHFLLFIISVVSSVWTSRSGMVLSVSSIIICLLFFKRQNIGINKITKAKTAILRVVVIIAVIFFGINIILPIVGSEFGFETKESLLVSGIQEDYVEGSVEGLLSSHLKPLENLSLSEWLFGTGRSLRQMNLNYSSDIGYVRQIFQLGLVGLFFMLSVIFYNWQRARRFYNNYAFKKNNENASLLFFLFTLTILVLLFMNYKNYFLFNRGKFELYFLFYYLTLNYCIRGYHESITQ